jgi:hypothetical protein
MLLTLAGGVTIGLTVEATALIATSVQTPPSFLNQHLSAARQVALQAVGDPQALPITTTYGNAGDRARAPLAIAS